MVARADGDVGLIHQRQKSDVRLRRAGKAQAEIGLPGDHRVVDVASAGIDQLDAHARVVKLKLRDDFGHKIVGGRRHAGDRNQARSVRIDIPDVGDGAL